MITGIVNNIGQFLGNLNTDNVRSSQSAKKQTDVSPDVVSVRKAEIEKPESEEPKENKKVEVKDLTAKVFFALDENKNVVIRIVDSEGKLLRQIPPEEYLKMVEHLQNHTKNLFSVEV